MNTRDEGGGIPDGGLFEVARRGPISLDDPLRGSLPERGALEVKPPAQDLNRVLRSDQVRRYLERYGKVIVTTMRAWTLVVADPGGRARRAETFVLADSEDEFWAAASHSRRTAASLEADFISFLERAIAQEAPLWSPQDLAWVLAAHARTALDRIELAAVPALDPLKAALSESLGLTFDDEDGEHFFRSTLVQTLFYGIFSAWVLWHLGGARPDERFRWHEASWHLRVPMVSVLFEKIATPSTLRPLGVEDVMAWTEDVLARVDRQRFFHRFEEGKAVQYFYDHSSSISTAAYASSSASGTRLARWSTTWSNRSTKRSGRTSA
jgi:hypothetical protein